MDGATKTQILSKLSRIITSLGNNEVCLLSTTFSELFPDFLSLLMN